MELLTNFEQKDETANPTPVIYTACGWVAGIFQPQKKRKKRLQGMLLTQDGQEIPAILDWDLLRRIKKKVGDRVTLAEFLQSVYCWKIYPRTQPLRFDIMKIAELPWQEQKPTKKNRKNSRPPIELDKFRVVGKIKYIADGKVVMRIECNEQVPNRRANAHPLYLKLTGSIATGEIGQIWELEVWRCGTKLTISKAKVYQPSEDDIRLFNLLSEQKNKSKETQADAPIHEADQTLDKTSAAADKNIQSAPWQDLEQKENKSTGCFGAAMTNAASSEVRAVVTKEKKQGSAKALLGTSLVASSGEVKPRQQSSRFSVQVNGQVFIGQNSITFNRRLLCIDGKPIAQSNLVVVIGQPKTMQADCSVTNGGNRSVLMSK